MRTVFCALFVDNGAAIVTVVSNRVEKYRLLPDRAHPERLWSCKIKHCLYLVEVWACDSIIATDTSGRHFGINTNSGKILWQTEPVGEGDRGVLLPDGTFLFASWKGVTQQLNPANGKTSEKFLWFGTQLRQLTLSQSGNRLTVVAQIPAKSDRDPVGEELCELDIGRAELREMLPNSFSNGMYISPDGRRVLCRYLGERDVSNGHRCEIKWVLREVDSGKTICERIFAPTSQSFLYPIWSPDGQLIASKSDQAHLFLSAESLKSLTHVAAKFPGDPAFDPVGTHVCLCRQNNTKIVRVADLLEQASS